MMYQTGKTTLLAGLLMSFAACSGGGSGQANSPTQAVPAPDTDPAPDPDPAATQPPSVTLNAANGSVASGGSTTLSWTSLNADSCQASGTWAGDLPTSGNQTAGPLTTSSTFSLTCSNSQGSAIVMVTVSISGELTLS